LSSEIDSQKAELRLDGTSYQSACVLAVAQGYGKCTDTNKAASLPVIRHESGFVSLDGYEIFL